MMNSNTFKLIFIAIILAFLLSGCGGTHTGTTSESTKIVVPSSRQMSRDPAPQSPPPQKTEPVSLSKPQPVIDSSVSREPPETVEVQVDENDVAFVKFRLAEYENKFQYWLEISEMAQEGELAAELTALETECVQNLERIMTGYSLLLERMQQSTSVPFDRISTVDPKKMQQLDIAFLESRCSEMLAMDIPGQDEFMPEEAAPELSFLAIQKTFAAYVEQGNYQEALFTYDRLSQDFPDERPSLETRLNYGLALQYTGQVEAAARQFKNILDSGDLAIEPLSLQREIADLLLAGGNFAAAESYYDNILLGHEAIGAEKTWAEEQLAFLRSVDPDSEDMIAYMNLLREFQMYDYRIDAPRLNEAINRFATEYAGRPVAVSALRLKTFAQDQLKSWFSRQLIKIENLVAAKEYSEATEILKNMTRFYLPAELQALVQKTYYDIAQAEMEEIETQRRIQEMELTEQWDAAVNLLDSQRYDSAILAFEALAGTEYEEQAKMKIIEAANQAASQMRKEAAALFIRAGKTPDIEQKKELLLASHKLLSEILVQFPQTDLSDKVQQNITILEEQIQRFDPALLEELRQEAPAELPPGSSGPYSRQLQ